MARLLTYTYKGETKTMPYSFTQFRTAHEAAAAAEGINIEKFLQTERQLEQMADGKAVKNHRDSYFQKLGFSQIRLLKSQD
ncbi:hypothetical protein VST7929_02886 [Vibrio stylophorae]|uniref:DUF2960 domain-containing protein n=1 Tax=Vibrio stylophorae TaxID=659351 RepID=A0ABN8DV81_9VIBR|nr:DUF2960 family protein [Vibrio stylophorae]CAH0535242.1 hypothetical protein VST7929_02886 [Vibrio stylophorae]